MAGMRLAAVDGMCLDVRPLRRTGRSSATRATMRPWPVPADPRRRARGVRDPGGAGRGALAAGRRGAAASPPAPGKLRPGDLLLADRNFLSHGLLNDVLDAGVHVLWRAKLTWTSRCCRCFPTAPSCRGSPIRPPPGACAARAQARRTFPASPSASSSTRWQARTPARSPRPSPCHRPARSRTADPGQAAAAYASRWQLETCFDELETSIRGGAAVVLRSKSPPMIRQEIYAMLCCYQAIRTLISHAAADACWTPPGSPSPAPATESAAASATPDAFPPTASTTSPPTWPSRSPSPATSCPPRPAAATSARPSGPAAGTRPASPASLPGSPR